MILEIGSQYNNDRNIYNYDKGTYRLSNGAGSKKELLVCGLFPVHAKCYDGDRSECNIPVLLS